MIGTIIGWFFNTGLGKILDTINNKVDNETERQRITADVVAKATDAQTRVLTGPGWWFPLFFIIPSGFWFSSVCIYSVFFCKGCMYPVSWSVAALPPPLDQWMGLIISGLFVGGFLQYLRR